MKKEKKDTKNPYFCGQQFSNGHDTVRLVQVGFSKFMLIATDEWNRWNESVLEGETVRCSHIPRAAFHKVFGKQWKLVKEPGKNQYDRRTSA